MTDGITIEESMISCPESGYSKKETIPTDACQ